MFDELLASDHPREVGGQGIERAECEIGALAPVPVLRRQAPHLVGVVSLEPGKGRAQARVLERGVRLDGGVGGLAKGDRGITWSDSHGAQSRDRVIMRNDLSQETAVHIDRVRRPPPAWRDPEFPDVHTGSHGSGYRFLSFMNELQEQRGLPPVDTSVMRPWAGRPTMRLAWWDKKQKRVRGVEIWADIVMTPYQWNHLHPVARRQVPHRLLPLAILGSHLLEPTRAPA